MNAKSIPDPDAKRRMLDVAVSYERLAEKAEERNRSLQGTDSRQSHHDRDTRSAATLAGPDPAVAAGPSGH